MTLTLTPEPCMQDGRISHLEHIFIRGGCVRFMTIPDMLKNAPMFKRIDPKYKVCRLHAYAQLLRASAKHCSLQAKKLPMGVGGRGRAVAARATAGAKKGGR